MKILKYKKKRDNRYQVFFDNGSDYEIYEDVILKSELLLKREIDSNSFKELLNSNKFYSCYYEGLKFIKIRSRSIREVKDKLKKNYNENEIEFAIDKMKDQGYLNDTLFANSYINEKINTTSHGPKRLIIELQKKGIDNEIINSCILMYDEDIQKEKIEKIITKMIKSNRNNSNQMLKRKICNNLIVSGFSASLVNDLISKESLMKDDDIKMREYEKIKRRLSNKYEGNELERKIREGLYRKGFY